MDAPIDSFTAEIFKLNTYVYIYIGPSSSDSIQDLMLEDIKTFFSRNFPGCSIEIGNSKKSLLVRGIGVNCKESYNNLLVLSVKSIREESSLYMLDSDGSNNIFTMGRANIMRWNRDVGVFRFNFDYYHD